MEQFANNAQSTLNGALAAGDATLVVTSAAAFPTLGTFRLIIDSEILLVTAVAGSTFTVTRGAEGTVAASHADLAPVTAILTSGAIARLKTDLHELGGVTFAFTDDADYVVTDDQYALDWFEFTTGAWTAGHSVQFPAPVSKAVGYYKTIVNNTAYAMTVVLVSGAGPKTLPAGTTRRYFFDNTGVNEADGTPLTAPTALVQEMVFIGALKSTALAAFDRAGGRKIDMAPYPASVSGLTRRVRFLVDVQKTAGATSVEVQLFDVTHGALVSSLLHAAGTGLTEVSSDDLTVGATAGNIRSDVAAMYEASLRMNGGGGGDQVFVTNARVLIFYS